MQCPLLVGVGEGEMFLASAAAAFLRDTNKIQLIEDGEVVSITPEGATFTSVENGSVEREVIEVDWDADAAEKSGYETFMLKEIYEQPEGVHETLGDRVRHGKLVLESLGLTDKEIRNLRRIVILACGTSYHAGVVGRYVIEEWARIPVEPDIASEWRYRNPVLSKDTLVIGISQSGETADVLAAIKLAKEKGARTVAITNMMGSQLTREVDSVLYTRTGLEVGVAASKTFTAQVALISLIALKLAGVKKTIPEDEIEFILDQLYELPEKMQAFLDGSHPIEEIAQRYYDKPFFLYLGRHIGLPVALEGALKLKEISYIPTEAYSAGEMKHGPIALLDQDTPVVCIATESHVYDKVVSNIQETPGSRRARDRDRDRRERGHPAPCGRRHLRPEDARVPPGRAGDPAAAAARVPDRPPARAERRPAAESGEDRHRRVAPPNEGRHWPRRPRSSKQDACGSLSTPARLRLVRVFGAHLRLLRRLRAAGPGNRALLLPRDRAGRDGGWRHDRGDCRGPRDRSLRRGCSHQRARSVARARHDRDVHARRHVRDDRRPDRVVRLTQPVDGRRAPCSRGA